MEDNADLDPRLSRNDVRSPPTKSLEHLDKSEQWQVKSRRSDTYDGLVSVDGIPSEPVGLPGVHAATVSSHKNSFW